MEVILRGSTEICYVGVSSAQLPRVSLGYTGVLLAS